MNLPEKYRPTAVYVVCACIVFAFAAFAKFLFGAFGLADTLAARVLIGFAACYLWLAVARKAQQLTTPFCDICRTRPCLAPACKICGKYQEPVHADHSHQDLCRCNEKRQAAA